MTHTDSSVARPERGWWLSSPHHRACFRRSTLVLSESCDWKSQTQNRRTSFYALDIVLKGYRPLFQNSYSVARREKTDREISQCSEKNYRCGSSDGLAGVEPSYSLNLICACTFLDEILRFIPFLLVISEPWFPVLYRQSFDKSAFPVVSLNTHNILFSCVKLKNISQHHYKIRLS